MGTEELFNEENEAFERRRRLRDNMIADMLRARERELGRQLSAEEARALRIKLATGFPINRIQGYF